MNSKILKKLITITLIILVTTTGITGCGKRATTTENSNISKQKLLLVSLKKYYEGSKK